MYFVSISKQSDLLVIFQQKTIAYALCFLCHFHKDDEVKT